MTAKATLLALALGLVSGRSWGAESEGLGEHRFLLPQLQDTSFVVTAFTSRLGGQFSLTDDVPLGDLGRRSLRFGALQQQLGFSVRLVEWAGLFVQGNGVAIAGLSGTSTLVRTVDAGGDVQGGVLFRLWRSDAARSQLAFRLGAGAATGATVGVLSILRAIEADPAATARSIIDGDLQELLLVPTSELSGRAALHFAHAFSSVFGLQLSLGAMALRRTVRPFDTVTRERVEVSDSGIQGEGALALAVNGAASGVPLATQLEYRFALGSLPLRAQDTTGHTVAAALYYSGRPDLQLGLEGSFLFGGAGLEGTDELDAPAQSDPTRRITAALMFRYVW